jgi:cellobiose phosphorylase
MTSRIENPYGYYDIQNHEYVITLPDTPTPWINYLGQGQYGGIISNTAGGFSFDRDPRNRRVTRYRYNAIPADQPGRYIYLKDQISGDYWSPTSQPVPTRVLSDYECRHGTAYTRIRSTYNGITVNLLYFVPPEYSCEVWVLNIQNNSKETRRLRSFSYAEFSFFDALTDLNNLDWGAHIFYSKYEGQTILTSCQFRPTITFFTSSKLPIGFDTDREIFIGPGRGLINPIVVEEGTSRQSEAPRGNNIGSLSHEWLLEPGGSAENIYILGVTDQHEDIPQMTERFTQIDNVYQAFEDLCKDWDDYLSKLSANTPDPEFNAMVNFWNPVQCRTTLYWSRFVSAYETGLGRGMGTRDSAQDTLALFHTDPDKARNTLNMLWHLQFRDGHTWHQVMPLTGEGGNGLAEEFPEWPQWFSDDHLWLGLAVCAYLRETGDFAYLGHRVPYWDGEDSDDTVWGHILRSIEFTLNNRGPHGLPRLGFADWDDTMNLDHGSGKAESVFTAQLFCRMMLDMTELAQELDRKSDSQKFLSQHHEMARLVQVAAWDGNWYIRGYNDDGEPVGTQFAQHQKISLNPQTWAVIGEIGEPTRLQLAMENAHEKLNSKFGLALLWPAYDTYDFSVQGTSTYPPGAKENGGIFCHANTWAIIAAAMLGWSDQAFEYYQQLLPFRRLDADHYAVEPYVYCGNICGPEHPQFGRGRNAWLSGTASWMYVAATQYILGIRPSYRGLQITPVVPKNWDSFSVIRMYRQVKYELFYRRVGPGAQVRILVDGNEITGNTIPIPSTEIKNIKVEVLIG